MSEKRYKVAVLGATGAVGREMLKVLDEMRFPASDVIALASPRSVGQQVDYGNRQLDVQAATIEALDGVDIVLASAGSAVSKQLLPLAAQRGCLCIDNSSAFRMHADVPLVVPEVNPLAMIGHKGIIANPNCSTIQMVVALQPLHQLAGLRRVVVATYQSVSGAGQKGIEELVTQTAALLNGKPFDVVVHNARIAFNVIPHIGDAAADGYTDEELKLVYETRKIMGLPNLAVCPTAVRVPVTAGHSESVVCEFERPITVAQARAALQQAHGITVVDDLAAKQYPMPMDCAESDSVFVGRIRKDFSVAHGLALWVVADNLRKGAATNAVQIAKLAVAAGLVHGA